ncbi:hypothetical protein SO802_032394 [Lithocarpus litseifolius]|uniref:Uncharacterized protein n=1 Tax=Lithocarpus litseifolius TaxID=425828 RepID=A0AAW2BP59_9ROSI
MPQDVSVRDETLTLLLTSKQRRRLEGIRYDSKEKHEYNLKDLQPKRRKLPSDSDMLCIEDIIKVILLCFVYEEAFYGQATKKKEHVNLEMFANARLVNEL